MKDPINIKGFWWLPDAADSELPGILTFSQDDGAFLEVVGVFYKTITASIEHPTIIMGMTQQGNPITLYKCMNIQGTLPLGGLGSAKYRVQFVFDGVHFTSSDDMKFNQLYGSYTDLDPWVNTNGFLIEQDFIDGKYIANVRYEKPSTQLFDISDDFEVGISFSFRGPSQSTVLTEVTVSQHACLVVKSKTGDICFESMFAQLNTFSYLLQVAAQRVVYSMTLFGLSNKNVQERDGGEPYYPAINIFYEPIEALVNQKPKTPNEMLFTFKDLETNQIKTWFDSFEKYKTIIHLYRALFYKDRLFIETKFLNISQALETLHSILFGGQDLSDEEFANRKEKVLQAVPQELHGWVKRALNNANYKPFVSRISDLLAKKSGYFTGLIDDIDLFAKRVRDTRNEFVHQNKLKWTFQRGKELSDAINWLTFLFEIYLLDIIGFSDEKIQELTGPKKQSLLTGWKHLRSGVK